MRLRIATTMPGKRVHFVPASFLFAAMVAAACSAPETVTRIPDPTTPVTLMTSLAGRYPARDFLSDSACSSDGLNTAIRLAKARVTEQISARVQSEWKSEYELHGNASLDSDKVTEAIRITARFDDGDLIHADPSTASVSAEQTCVAAYIVRADAEARLADRWIRQADAIRAALRKMRTAGDSVEAPIAWHDAVATVNAIPAACALWRTLVGQAPPGETEILDGCRDLIALADRLRSRSIVLVRVGGQSDAALTDFLTQAVLRLLANEGIAATASPAGCAEAPVDRRGILLDAKVEESCRRISLGIACSTRVTVAGGLCERSGDVFRFTLDGANPAVHASDEHMAREKARAGVSEAKLREGILAALPSLVPSR